MKSTFGVKKFKSLLVAGTFTVIANYVVRLTDAVIAGNMIGTSALAGVNLVSPVLSAVAFLAGLISTGMATNYSIAMGRMEERRAWGFFMQAFWSVLIVGGAVGFTIFFCRDGFLSFFGASAEVSSSAAGYLTWIWPVALTECFVGMLVSLGYADGDSKLCVAAYGAIFIVNLGVSTVAVMLGMGTAGCALGTVVAELAGIGVMAIHFCRKSNTLRIVRHFSLRDSWLIAKASFGDSAAFLCDALLFLFINKFLIVRFGSGVLPIAAVASMLWGFLELFNGIGVAVQPIVTVYYGEGNTVSIRRVMNCAMAVAAIEGVILMAVFGLFPGLVVSLAGLVHPEAVAAVADLAVREMCFGFVPLAFAGLFNSYYMFIERSGLAGIVTFLCYLVMPVACVAGFSLFGEHWVWLGIGFGPVAGMAIVTATIVFSGRKGDFPLLLPQERDAKLHVFDLLLNDSEIVETSNKVGLIEGVPLRAALMTEEVLMVVKERAKGRTLFGEVTVDLNDGVKLTLRDDGDIFDITDANAEISSLRTFLVASVMERQSSRANFVTTGFNRNVFKF